MEEASELEQLKAAYASALARIEELEVQLAALREQVERQSKPPSPPGDKPQGSWISRGKAKRKTGKRGARKGHRGAHRQLVPVDEVDEVVDLYPGDCMSCWESLPEVPDARAKRYQQTDLKPLAAHVTEWRRHAVSCPHCGHRTRATYDRHILPRYAFGPRLTAVVVLMTGVYHLSRRQTVGLLRELLGVKMSLGSVSAIEKRVSRALGPVVDELTREVRDAPVKHADGTTWWRCGKRRALWVVATATATVFQMLPDGCAQTLRETLFVRTRGILVSDRASALMFWRMSQRQVCWAHLLRKFVAFSERDGPAAEIGAELLDYTRLLFDYWSSFREGRLSRATLLAWMAPVRAQFEAVLAEATRAELPGLSGSCSDILAHREALWTFLERSDVEPTNNHAERELRGFVLWRRRSFGSQSEAGDVFAARIMTVAHTARKLGRNVLDVLSACCRSPLAEDSPPSLLPA